MKVFEKTKTLYGKIKTKCSNVYARLRRSLQKAQTRYPRLYEPLYKALLWVVDILPVILGACGASSVLMIVVLTLAFFFGILLYGATLKNKYDAISKRELNNAIDELDDLEKELAEYKVQSALMYYKLAEKISDGCSYMVQEGADKENCLLNDLDYLAKKMESMLTGYYTYPVSVNIKLVIPEGKVRTYARGTNNIANRGGEQVIYPLNLKSSLMNDNYALNLIVRNQIECFIEADLTKMKTKVNQNDEFYCDRKNWSDYFNSTAIFAIRGRSRHQPHSHNTQYEVYGFICIDAKETTDWHKSDDCIVYTFGAFCANMLYEYLAAYKTAEKNTLQKGEA